MHKDTVPNFPAAFLAQVDATPDQPAVIFPEVTFSYAQLRDLAAAFAIRFKAAGIGQHATLRLHSDDLAVIAPSLLAASILGARVAIWGQNERDAGITHEVVTTRQASERAQVLIDETYSPSLFSASEKADVWGNADQVNPQDPWLLFKSSVPGADAQIVAISQILNIARAAAMSDGFDGSATRLALIWPTASYAFAARVVAALFSGATLVDRALWQSFPQLGVTHLSAPLEGLKPLFSQMEIEDKIANLEIEAGDLSNKEIAALLSGFVQIHQVLESAETGKVHVNIFRTGDAGTVEKSGHAIHATLKTDFGSTGILKIKARDMVDAYAFADDTAPSALQDGWFHPGLLAQLSGNGTLTLIGPADDHVIAIGAETVRTSLIDCVLKSCDGIVDAIAFANPKPDTEEIIAFVIYEDGANRFQVVEFARQSCAKLVGAAFVPTKLWPIDAIPLTDARLPDRVACAMMILNAAQS